MKILKRIWLELVFLVLTFRTAAWANRTFSRLCCMDWPTVCVLETGVLRAAGNTVDYEPVDGRHFVISELEPGRIIVREEQLSQLNGVYYKEVYRQHRTLKSLEWVWSLKKLNKYLKKSGAYRQRELELLEEMKEGQITTTMM